MLGKECKACDVHMPRMHVKGRVFQHHFTWQPSLPAGHSSTSNTAYNIFWSCCNNSRSMQSCLHSIMLHLGKHDIMDSQHPYWSEKGA